MANRSQRSRGRLVLRNEARKKGDLWVGTCLELNIVVTAKTVGDLKREMNTAIQLYCESVKKSKEEGLEPVIVPVKFYWLRRIWFDIRFRIMRRIDGIQTMQWQQQEKDFVFC